MNFSFADALNYSLFVLEAYQTGTANPPYNPPNGFQLLTPLFANDLATDISNVTAFVPIGYVARSGSTVVVALRGTQNVFEWIEDARFDRIRCLVPNGSGETEDGFSSMYASLGVDGKAGAPTVVQFLQANVQAGDTIVVCGHSLGAALAVLCAYDCALNLGNVSVALYNYACPNVGDDVFANSFNATVPNAFLVVNPFDIVTHVPPRLILGYQVVGQAEPVNPAGRIRTNVVCFHALNSYMYLMSLAAGVPSPVHRDLGCS